MTGRKFTGPQNCIHIAVEVDGEISGLCVGTSSFRWLSRTAEVFPRFWMMSKRGNRRSSTRLRFVIDPAARKTVLWHCIFWFCASPFLATIFYNTTWSSSGYGREAMLAFYRPLPWL